MGRGGSNLHDRKPRPLRARKSLANRGPWCTGARAWVSATGATAAAVLGQGAGLIGAMLIGVVSIPSLATDNISLWIVPTALLTATLLVLSPVVFNAVCRIWFRVARTEAPEGLSNRDGARWIILSFGSWCMYTGAFWAFSRGLASTLACFQALSFRGRVRPRLSRDIRPGWTGSERAS